MSLFDYIILALTTFGYGGILGATIAWAYAKMEQCDHLSNSNRDLHHQLKLERIRQDNEHYIRHRNTPTG